MPTCARAAIQRLWASWGILAILGGGACGHQDNTPDNSSAICAANWRPITERAPYVGGLGLRYVDQTLYFSPAYWEGEQLVAPIVSLSTLPGAVAVPLGTTNGFPLKVEGDHLLYISGDRFSSSILSVPRTGGASTTLLTRPLANGLDFLVAENAFYTREFPATNYATEVLRVARPDGAPVQIASLSRAQDPLAHGKMALSTDSILLASDSGQAIAIPVDGSPPRQLATLGFSLPVLAVDATGVWTQLPHGPTDRQMSLSFTPADGGPHQEKSYGGFQPDSELIGFWALPDGRRLFSGTHSFDDGVRSALWLSDAATNQVRLLACDPSPAGDANGPAAGAFQDLVFGDDAIYAVAVYYTEQPGGREWRMIRIPYE